MTPLRVVSSTPDHWSNGRPKIRHDDSNYAVALKKWVICGYRWLNFPLEISFPNNYLTVQEYNKTRAGYGDIILKSARITDADPVTNTQHSYKKQLIT